MGITYSIVDHTDSYYDQGSVQITDTYAEKTDIQCSDIQCSDIQCSDIRTQDHILIQVQDQEQVQEQVRTKGFTGFDLMMNQREADAERKKERERERERHIQVLGSRNKLLSELLKAEVSNNNSLKREVEDLLLENKMLRRSMAEKKNQSQCQDMDIDPYQILSMMTFI
jgi:hypothetical protein